MGAPTSGSSTNTTSPSCSWAWSVIPTVTVSPSIRTHSWSLEKKVAIKDLRPAMVAMRDKGQGDNPRRQRPAADDKGDLGVGCGPLRHDVAQGDWAADGRSKAAASDATERRAIGRLDLGALARRRLAVGPQPDQPA